MQNYLISLPNLCEFLCYGRVPFVAIGVVLLGKLRISKYKQISLSFFIPNFNEQVGVRALDNH